MTPPIRITGPSRPPHAGGPPRQLVILLHGLGSDGADLLGLAPSWAPLLPQAEFLAPNAPEPSDMSPFGHQWFSLRDWTLPRMFAGAQAAAAALDAFIDDALAARRLTDGDLALVGFSQGTMMALHVALRRPRPCAGVVGYSGMLLGPEALPAAVRSRPPILLVHGERDEVVPALALPAAVEALERSGLEVEHALRPGLGHSVDAEGLALGARFLKGKFATPA